MLRFKQQTVNSKQQTAGQSCVRFAMPSVKRPMPGRVRRLVSGCLLFAVCCLLTTACRRDMQDQPKMKPYRSTVFFKDGLSSRQLVAGTVPRGFLKTDTEFFTGKKAGRTTATASNQQAPAASQPVAGANIAPNVTGPAAYPDDVEMFPLPVTKELVERGKQRYDIFCTVCHGPTGNGDGMIVRRGFRRAASFNDDRLRQAPVGHFFDAVTNGWGAMPAYAAQIPAQDRWAIIAYIRALQLSQQSQQPQPAAAAASATPATQSGGQHQ
ncbi:MAG TPA: cytochrome c, partial [Pyrinomonadaceae bacterium]|jgi:mono/diheme cytochrome c family protein|nr:cytochrome c [Pyrinomonadaceae bacterium]